jgi:hypothetical protein
MENSVPRLQIDKLEIGELRSPRHVQIGGNSFSSSMTDKHSENQHRPEEQNARILILSVTKLIGFIDAEYE